MAQGLYSWGYRGTRDKATGLGLDLRKKQGSSDAYFWKSVNRFGYMEF